MADTPNKSFQLPFPRKTLGLQMMLSNGKFNIIYQNYVPSTKLNISISDTKVLLNWDEQEVPAFLDSPAGMLLLKHIFRHQNRHHQCWKYEKFESCSLIKSITNLHSGTYYNMVVPRGLFRFFPFWINELLSVFYLQHTQLTQILFRPVSEPKCFHILQRTSTTQSVGE